MPRLFWLINTTTWNSFWAKNLKMSQILTSRWIVLEFSVTITIKHFSTSFAQCIHGFLLDFFNFKKISNFEFCKLGVLSSYPRGWKRVFQARCSLLVATFASLVAYKQTVPNLKIFLSVGGWTLTSQLVAISATDAARNAFVSSVVTNLRAWGLDGLDVDWEFPLAADKTSYSTLLTVNIISNFSDSRKSRQLLLDVGNG